jgi:WD40 repeat protein
MKAGAIVLAAIAVALGDVTPRASWFNPKRLREERSFAAPRAWLMSAGGRFIATTTGDDSFGIIDVASGRDLGAFGAHKNAAMHDGNWGGSDRYLATCDESDAAVKVWDATTRKEVLSISPHPGYACAVSVSADGKMLATGGSVDGQVKIFEIPSGRELHSFEARAGASISSIEFDSRGQHVVASGDSALVAINLSTGTRTVLLESTSWIPEYRFSLDGRYLAAVPRNPPTIVIWDARTWKELRRIGGELVGSNHGYVAFSRDSRYVAAIDKLGRLRFWDPATGADVHTMGEGLKPVGPLEFMTDGRVLVTGADDRIRVLGPGSKPSPGPDRK